MYVHIRVAEAALLRLLGVVDLGHRVSKLRSAARLAHVKRTALTPPAHVAAVAVAVIVMDTVAAEWPGPWPWPWVGWRGHVRDV